MNKNRHLFPGGEMISVTFSVLKPTQSESQKPHAAPEDTKSSNSQNRKRRHQRSFIDYLACLGESRQHEERSGGTRRCTQSHSIRAALQLCSSFTLPGNGTIALMLLAGINLLLASRVLLEGCRGSPSQMFTCEPETVK